MKRVNKDVAQSIKITKEEWSTLKDRAKELGLSVSNLIRLVMFNYGYISSDTKTIYNEKTGNCRSYKCAFTGHLNEQPKAPPYNNYEKYMLGVDIDEES